MTDTEFNANTHRLSEKILTLKILWLKLGQPSSASLQICSRSNKHRFRYGLEGLKTDKSRRGVKEWMARKERREKAGKGDDGDD